jgi:uncharacterized membrane protein HdeD (DUF308 family)
VTESQYDSTDSTGGPVSGTDRLVGHFQEWLITFGVLTVLAGILVLSWPGLTVSAIAVIVGVQMLVAGVFRLVRAFGQRAEDGGGSWTMMALLGGEGIVLGILFLRHSFQTVGALALLLGLFWTIGGVIEIFHTLSARPTGWGWELAGGELNVIAGIVVLTHPPSLATLMWFLGVPMVVYGGVMIGSGIFRGRTAATIRPAAASRPASW